MKNIRKFETTAERDAWLNSGDFVSPNVALTEGLVEYNLISPAAYPLYIEAIENLTIKFGNTYQYSKDNSTWSSGTSSTSISANAGEKVYFRASGLTPDSSNGIGKFTISNGKCNVGGNVMSMAYGADFKDQRVITNTFQFYWLFRNCSTIVDASSLALPATTLAKSCYSSMFYGCTSLTTAPALPATTLAKSCYYYMFYNCSSLVTAPALPATTLAESCYYYMFYNCSSLVTAPALPATTLAKSCYSYMFYNCSSLVNAPELPATTLAESCYYYMFNGCSNLNYIKAMFKTTPSKTYTENWVKGVAATGTFVKNSAATWNVTGVNGIPEGWTVETASA